MKLDKRETATVLAALRMWQRLWLFESEKRDLLLLDGIADILDAGDGKPPLDESEIDDLCDLINFDE